MIATFVLLFVFAEPGTTPQGFTPTTGYLSFNAVCITKIVFLLSQYHSLLLPLLAPPFIPVPHSLRHQQQALFPVGLTKTSSSSSVCLLSSTSIFLLLPAFLASPLLPSLLAPNPPSTPPFIPPLPSSSPSPSSSPPVSFSSLCYFSFSCSSTSSSSSLCFSSFPLIFSSFYIPSVLSNH